VSNNRRFVIAVVLALVPAVAVFATPVFKSAFDKTYKPKSGTALAKAGCAVCHVKVGSKALNPYGKALKGRAATDKSLRAIEKLDSDKDKASNIAEIKAGTLPGDPKSKPAAKPKK
jgi:mono/diheme cytochrome c family protein